jgi:outer membrane scaffolding protein for murein synthesis (MipA/OmpV family)
LTFAFGLLCVAIPLRAAEAEDPRLASGSPSWVDEVVDQAHEWNVTLGAGFAVSPKFEGADDVEIMPIPFVSADFGPYVSVDPMGLTINALDYEGFSVKGKIGGDFGRDSSDDKHLHGLGDIGAGLALGLDLAYNFEPVEFTASIEKTIGGSDGLTAEFGFSYSVPVDQFIFSIGPSITWADSNYMESYFGVTDRQSRKSGLSRFDADAGFKRVDLEISGMYMIDENWMVRAEVGFGALIGDAADSPVSQTNFQPSTMFMVGYRF